MNYLKKIAKVIFQYEARLVLKKYKPKVIAITGSVGKTITRDAVYQVLSKKFFVRKSEKSFTADLGIPLAVIGCDNGTGSIFQWTKNILNGFWMLVFKSHYPQWLVLEVDADKKGDLKTASSVISPDILVMTAIGDVPAHIEMFEDIEDFISEKSYIIESVKRDGVIVYNSNDPRVSNLLIDVKNKKIQCGVGLGSDIFCTDFSITYSDGGPNSLPKGMEFDINYREKSYPINIKGSVGVSNQYASVLAFAVGVELGVSTHDIVSALNSFTAPQGRMNLISGLKETVMIDDSYNSSPIAMVQAVDTLSRIKTEGRKVVVVGDMFELGKFSADEHRKLAKVIKDVADYVICVGLRARRISEVLLDNSFNENNIISVDTAESAGGELQNILEKGDVVLVKGSQAMRMERVVEEVMRHPEDKQLLLVRQEEEWKGR
ncbi:MAG: UDP-N-acetylmuramoyl-tripeptide--D-alanyl-D-alanine ligase [Nitrospira sp.]